MVRRPGATLAFAACAFAACAAALSLPASGANDPCLTTHTIVLDPSFANTYADTDLGEGLGQSFLALGHAIRSITVWRHPAQATLGAGVRLYLMGTDANGAPLGGDILFTSATVTNTTGDGVHPVPLVFEIDPPVALQDSSEYCFMLFASPCGVGSTILAYAETPDGYQEQYPDGQLWHENHRWACEPLPYPVVSHPHADVAFRVEFCDIATTVRQSSWGRLKSLYR